MIIDMRTHIDATAARIAPDHDDPLPDHHDAMSCVDACVVLGSCCERMGVSVSTERIAAFVAEDPDSRVGFAGINPLADSAFDDIAEAVELGMTGVTIAPADQGYRPTHDRCLEALERCATHALPVLVANPLIREPGSVLEYARPALLDEAARQFPGLTLVLGDLGAAWLDEAYSMIAKHPRVFAEISGVVARPWGLYSALMAAFEREVIDKLLFGSGFPRETPERAIERIYTINMIRGSSSLPTIPRELLRSIVERDALERLGIGAAVSAREEAISSTDEHAETHADSAGDRLKLTSGRAGG